MLSGIIRFQQSREKAKVLGYNYYSQLELNK